MIHLGVYLLFYRIAGVGGLFSGFDVEAWSGNWGGDVFEARRTRSCGVRLSQGLVGMSKSHALASGLRRQARDPWYHHYVVQIIKRGANSLTSIVKAKDTLLR